MTMKVLKAQTELEQPHPRALQDALAYTAKRCGYSLSVLHRHFIVSPWTIEPHAVHEVVSELFDSAVVILGTLTPISRTDHPHYRMHFRFRIERVQPKGKLDTLDISIYAPTPMVANGH